MNASQLRGNGCLLVGHSPAVMEVFELMNVAAYFGDHLVMDSSERKK
jgi:anti-anti-sigma regulatory factor